MKNKELCFLSLAFILSSCQGSGVRKPVEDYQVNLSYQSDSFHIFQMSDIHWNYTTDWKKSEKYMESTFAHAKKTYGNIDLVVITGDTFLDANKDIAEELFTFLSKWNVPIACTYGNHDKEGTWNTSWMNEKISKTKNFIAKINDGDDVYGDTNYFVDILSKDNLLWRLYLLDSNSLSLKNPFKYQYDNIHEDQVEWMKRVDASEERVPSLAFFHIPPKEFHEAFEKSKRDKSLVLLGEAHEDDSSAKEDSTFFETAKDVQVKGMFFGHDHVNDLVLQYQDMIMGYGMKSNIELYSYKEENGFDHTGYALYTLNKDHSWGFDHVYLDYENPEQTKTLSWRSSL